MDRWDPDAELPIKLGPCSNGEFRPLPLGPVERETIRRTRVEAEHHARRLGMGRREFLRSLGGAALMLGVLAACHDDDNRARGKRSGGTYKVDDDAATEPDAAKGAIAGDEVIVDVQTHYLNYDLAVAGGISGLAGLSDSFPQGACGEADSRACYSVEQYLDLLFGQSDTNMVVLSSIPIPEQANPLTIDDMELARRLAVELCGDDRVLLHGGVQPTVGPPGLQIDGMSLLVAEHPIAAWKIYTHAPGRGWWLDDHDADSPQVGNAFPTRVEAVGPRIVCVHKGFSGGTEHASPADIGPAAKAHPRITFVVYHSGFESTGEEGPYTAATAEQGVNRLVTTLQRAGLEPGANVYAELGSTWWVLMRNPTQAAHVLGKLLLAVGPDRILWGTDSLWYGSPQDQIQAFRAFEIAPELQEQYGYPALTAEIKRKILGENAIALYGVDTVPERCTFTRDDLAALRVSMPEPWRTYGPATDQQLAALLADHGIV